MTFGREGSAGLAAPLQAITGRLSPIAAAGPARLAGRRLGRDRRAAGPTSAAATRGRVLGRAPRRLLSVKRRMAPSRTAKGTGEGPGAGVTRGRCRRFAKRFRLGAVL